MPIRVLPHGSTIGPLIVNGMEISFVTPCMVNLPISTKPSPCFSTRSPWNVISGNFGNIEEIRAAQMLVTPGDARVDARRLDGSTRP